MRITKLRVDGFGVWNGLSVDRIEGELTLFYGRNEAGKTTLMQFIRSILYGFTEERASRYLPPVYGGNPGGELEVQVPDNKLRMLRHQTVGAENTIEGNLDIRGSNGHHYGEDYLQRVLYGVDETIFNHVFAIGLQEIQELATLDGTDAAKQLYKLASGVDRVSLIDVMHDLEDRRRHILDVEANPEEPSLLAELWTRRRELLRDIEQRKDNGRAWANLTENHRDLDNEIKGRKEQLGDLERRSRLFEVATQLREYYYERQTFLKQLEELHKLPDERDLSIPKLEKLNNRIQEHAKQIEELVKKSDSVKQAARTLPVNTFLWQQASRVEATSEHQHWVASLQRQIDRLTDEAHRLMEELGEKPTEGSLRPVARDSNMDQVEVDKKSLLALRNPARDIREAKRRVEEVQQELDRADEELSRLRNELETSLTQAGCENLIDSFDEAGKTVQNLRKLQAIDERADRLNHQRRDLEAELDDALEDQMMSTNRLTSVGALVVFGIALVLYGWGGYFVKEFSTEPLIGFFGAMVIMMGLGLKKYWDTQATERVDLCKHQFDMVRQELQKIKSEREVIERELPSGFGSSDGRLMDAQRRMQAIEQLMPLEGQVAEAQEYYRQAEELVQQATEEYEKVMEDWREALRSLGLSETLSPAHVKALSMRSDRVAQAQLRLSQCRHEIDQHQDDLMRLAERIGQLCADAHVKPLVDDPLGQLKQLEAELRAQQTLMDKRSEHLKEYKRYAKTRQIYKRKIARLKRLRATMFSKVGVDDDASFRKLAQQHDVRRSVEGKVSNLDKQIKMGLGNQYSMNEVAQLIEQYPKKELDKQWELLLSEIENHESTTEEMHVRRGEMAQQLKAMLEDCELDELRFELATVESKLARAVKEWQELGVASSVLESLREFYEGHRQPETLKDASKFLQKISGGKYDRIWTRMVGNALLVDNSQGETLPIDVLSRGTREAVFLSLRLALVTGYARRGIKLPMIMDDVLVNFDTERAKSAAEVLREFAQMGHQVLFFTCHNHMCDIFRSVGADIRTLPQRKSNGGIQYEVQATKVEEAPPPAEVEVAPPTPVIEEVLAVEPEVEKKPRKKPKKLRIDQAHEIQRELPEPQVPVIIEEPVQDELIVVETPDSRERLQWHGPGLWWDGSK